MLPKAYHPIFATTLGLVTLSLSHHRGMIQFPRLSSSPHALQCKEALTIAHWGISKQGIQTHDLLKTRELDDARTTEKALEVFVEKVDPYKVLYTKTEIEDFKTQGRKEWLLFINQKSCNYFTAWLEGSYPIAQKRLFETIQKHSFVAPPKLKLDPKNNSFSKPAIWATTELELKNRVLQLGTEILKTTPKSVLEAYRGNFQALVLSSIEENVLVEDLVSGPLLAKALLGTIDPYTTYFSPPEFDDFYSELSGGTAGVGIRIRKVPSGLLVEEVIKNSSAEKSQKIHKEDTITRVNGIRTARLTMNEARRLLKGPEESTVKIELRRGSSKTESVELTRRRFEFEDIKISSQILNSYDGTPIGIVSIPNFYAETIPRPKHENTSSSAEDLRRVLKNFATTSQKPKALVIDLRGNPGGYLEEAVTMASFFVGSKPVVGVVEKNTIRVLKQEFQEPLYKGKLIILADAGTASAAEVLAGALGDLQRAILVGSTKTYGKGTVQKLFSIDEELLVLNGGPLDLSKREGNGFLKLTTSIFYSPLGHSPANGGIKSDVSFPDSFMVSKEDYGIAPTLKVKEEKPFLGEEELLELQLKQERRKNLILSLQEESASRLRDSLVASMEDRALLEASSIAADLVKKEPPAF